MDNQLANSKERFKIGAVERLTGIPANSIRVWERRHQAVTPHRSKTGTRYYSEQDVERLKVIRHLTENGDTISEVASLPLEALRERLQGFQGHDQQDDTPQRVLLIGSFSRKLIAQLADEPLIHSVVQVDDEIAAAPYIGDVDFLIKAQNNLHRDQLSGVCELLRKLKARRVMIVYQFASSQSLKAFADAQILVTRFPVQLADITSELYGHRPLNRGDQEYPDHFASPIEAPRFSTADLIRISDTSTSVRCECPHHLANLIHDLHAFEKYSLECTSRSEQDAWLHSRLHQTTAHCRMIMERMLVEVMEHEQITLPGS